MSLEFETIEQGLIDTIRNLIGSSLSTVGSSPVAAVIRARQAGPIPKTHYITFENITLTDFGGWLRNRDVSLTSTPDVNWLTEKTLVYRIYCYGDLCLRLLEELVMKLNISSNRFIINATGARIVEWRAPTLVPRIIADEYSDNAFFDLIINAPSLEVETTNDEITSVHAENSETGDEIDCP